jgi:hypothetical protein
MTIDINNETANLNNVLACRVVFIIHKCVISYSIHFPHYVFSPIRIPYFTNCDPSLSSGEGGGGGEKTPTQLGPLERANLNHWRTETDPVSETSCFYSQEHQTMEKVQNPSNSVCYTPSLEPFNVY